MHGTNGLWREQALNHSLVGPMSRTEQLRMPGVTAPFDQEVIFHHLDADNTPAARQRFQIMRNDASPAASGEAKAGDAPGGGPVTGTDGSTQVQRSDGPQMYKVRWLGRAK